MNTADKFARLAALRPAAGVVRNAELRPPEEEDAVARLLGAGVARNEFGEHLTIRNWFSTPEFAEPSGTVLELLTRGTQKRANGRGKKLADLKIGHYRDARSAASDLDDPAKWLFLDTETTGLAGGTGTYAFLVGLAWWDAGGLQMEQMFLRDFSEEHSLLQELAARIAERPVLVTFNGKSFDWPLLENRFTMTRKISVPRLAAHLDLLHPSRALWKMRLGSVRLVELERQVLDAARLGWHREDDVASALIPQYYFDYLRGGTATPLAGVVKHNQMDLRGLAALFGKINSLLDERGAAQEETDSRDLFGLSRFLQRRGESGRAQTACTKALDAGLPVEYRPQATRDLALMAKRRGDFEEAAELWRELAHDAQDGIAACEELAMHYERRAKDYALAVEFTELGLTKATRSRKLSREPYWAARAARWEEKFMCRLARLRHRIGKEENAPRAPLLAQAAAAGAKTRGTR